MDTGLNRNAAIIVKDIYPSLCRRLGREPLPDSRLLGASRVISALFGIIIIALALYYARSEGAGVFEIMIGIGAYLGTPMAVPMFLGLFFRRLPGWSALVSVVAGLAASLAMFLSPKLGGPAPDFQSTVFVTFGVGTLAFLACRPGWAGASAEYRARVSTFFERMHTPVDFEKEVGGANDLRQLIVLGGFAMAIGLLILAITPFTGSWRGAAQTGAISFSMLAVGFLMWRTGKKSPPPIHRPAHQLSPKADDIRATERKNRPF